MKSLGKFPDPFIAGIAGQPDALRRAAEALVAQAGKLEALARAAAGRTPILTGMGSSYDACYPAVAELAARGRAAVMLDTAELLHFRSGILGPQTLLLVVSQSGESAEVVRLVEDAAASSGRPFVAAVTNGTSNRLAVRADLALDTAAGEEEGPSTVTFAAALVAMAGATAAIAGDAATVLAERMIARADVAAAALERIVGDATIADRVATWFGDRETLVVLGRGPARAAAEMGALTIKEAVGMPVESLETAQFRHGPVEIAGPDLAAIVIATEPETFDLDTALAAELVDAGAAVLLVTASGGKIDGAMTIEIGSLDRMLAPAVSIVPSQLLAWKLALMRGRDPGRYVRATKVTTRE